MMQHPNTCFQCWFAKVFKFNKCQFLEVLNQSKLTTNGKEALLVKAVKNFPNNIEILPRAFSKKKTSFLPKSKPYECSVKSAGHAESRLGSGWAVKGGVRPPSQGCQPLHCQTRAQSQRRK